MRKYLVTLREKSKYSQQNVAEKLNITTQYYQMIEKGKRQRKMEVTLATQLANIFNISLEELLDEERKSQVAH